MKSNLLVGCSLVLFFVLFLSGHAKAEESNLDIEMANYIMQCESGGNTWAVNERDALITGYVSRGLFQFQIKTFLAGAIRYGVLPEGTTIKEALKYVHRPEYNAAVAHGLLADGKWRHWRVCANRYFSFASR